MKRFGVVIFPGSNCDRDCMWAIDQSGASAVAIWHRSADLCGVDGVVLPGGFSYGDYLRAGALAARSPVMAAVSAFAEAGGPVVGICNGFQLLTEIGLLPGALLMNDHLRFRCQTVDLQVARTDTVVTSGYQQDQVLKIPIAHKEGCFYAASDELARLERQGAVAFRYVGRDGAELPGNSELNPNGSLHAIAGLANRAGNVVGLMPHPERRMEEILGGSDGVPFFKALAEAA